VQVAHNSIIWTDEHWSYSCLNNYDYTNETVCHKYQFVIGSGVNTQAVESLYNIIKYEIKNRKGIRTNDRSNLLKEIWAVWTYLSRILGVFFFSLTPKNRYTNYKQTQEEIYI
jgi:hypothetical protein